MVGHVMICRLSGLAVVILLPIRVPVAREASFRRTPSMELPSADLRTLCYTVFLLVNPKVADATAGVRHRSWLRGRRMAA